MEGYDVFTASFSRHEVLFVQLALKNPAGNEAPSGSGMHCDSCSERAHPGLLRNLDSPSKMMAVQEVDDS